MASRILDINICLGAWETLEGSLNQRSLLCGRFLDHTPLSVPFRQLLGYQNMWEVGCDRNAPRVNLFCRETHGYGSQKWGNILGSVWPFFIFAALIEASIIWEPRIKSWQDSTEIQLSTRCFPDLFAGSVRNWQLTIVAFSFFLLSGLSGGFKWILGLRRSVVAKMSCRSSTNRYQIWIKLEKSWKPKLGGISTHFKNISQNWIISPNRDENKKYLKPPPSKRIRLFRIFRG